ncbi:MAG TPA: DUF3891 family protein [Tepidisphaeraceae bacterium]|nr:DUF3891 family protein [Tepidisphaeraceae bacterium]
MIRRQDRDEFLLITQHDHALIAGELAEHVGNGYFGPPEPREAALIGIAQHDSGWPLHDDEPTLNKAGQPLDVFETTREIALKVWTASVDRATAKHPYAGLLASLHVLSLSVFATTQTEFEHEKFDLESGPDRFAVAKFQHKEIERQEQLRAKLGLRTDRPTHHRHPQESDQAHEDQLTFNFRLLQAMDAISLAACCTNPPSAQTQDVMPHPGAAPIRLNLRRDGNDVIVDPWPFDVEEIGLMIPASRVPGRAYGSAADLRDALRTAPSEIITCRVLPAHHA